MSFAAFRLRPLLRSLAIAYHRDPNHVFRVRGLFPVQTHNLCNVAFQADLSVDKRLLDQYVEEIVRDNGQNSPNDLGILIEKRVQLLKNISSLDSLRAGLYSHS